VGDSTGRDNDAAPRLRRTLGLQRTDQDPGRELRRLRLGQHARKHFFLFRGIEDPVQVRCVGISSQVDRAKNTFRVSVPADCLSRPRWVGMGLLYYVHAQHGRYLVDDSLGPDVRNFFRRLRVTARLSTS
jgi:hypothetical protein